MNASITYEQPLNEIIRVCLRLERLFEQLDHQRKDMTMLGMHQMIATLINLLHLLDRPDLKAKLAKELSHHLTALARYSHLPELDKYKYEQITNQLNELSSNFIESSGKIGYRLREIELLNTLRMHLASPGGGCSFDIPIYHYWLKQPKEWQQATIDNWLHDFKDIRLATGLVLDLVRKNEKIHSKQAIHGFHQELLDPQLNLRMIRIGVDPQIPTFPEISVGRHVLSVRFLTPTIEKPPTQYTENFAFELSYCT